MNNAARIFIKAPLTFKSNIFIYPPSVREVISNDDYGVYLSTLTMTQYGLIDEWAEKGIDGKCPTPFEFILMNCYHSKQFEVIAKAAFKFFLKEDVTFVYDPKAIIVGDLEKEIEKIDDVSQLRLITEDDFFDFQNCIRQVMGMKLESKDDLPNPDEDPRITEIKRKARQRERIKAKSKNKGGISLEVSLAAICCMGIGITPLNVGEISYASVSMLLSMCQNKEKYEIDIQSLLAGADAKKLKPKYWIRNFDD